MTYLPSYQDLKKDWPELPTLCSAEFDDLTTIPNITDDLSLPKTTIEQRTIPTIFSNRIKRVNCSNKVRRSNLIKVPLSRKHNGLTSRLPRILLCNARSLWPKIDELATILDLMRTDVAAITETWLHGGLDDSLVSIGGYTLYI